MRRFFSRLSYSIGNEDWRTEAKALKIQQTDRILCVTASGDRPLNLLLQDPQSIVTIDANAVQNHLLRLKAAALRELAFEEYLDFILARKEKPSQEMMQRVFRWLIPETKFYWNCNRSKIESGILYGGYTEMWCKVLSKLVHLIRGQKIDRLFSMEDLAEQRLFVQKEWDTWGWRKFYDWLLNNPIFSKFLLADPGLHFNISSTIRPGAYLYARMNTYFMNHLAKSSLLFSLLLRGKVDDSALPPYLLKTEGTIIKERLDRLVIHTQDLLSFLKMQPDNSFDCFSFSDVASYISAEDFALLMRELYRVARPCARFSVRQFMSEQVIPRELSKVLQRDEKLEAELEREDNCGVYRFMVGQVLKAF